MIKATSYSIFVVYMRFTLIVRNLSIYTGIISWTKKKQKKKHEWLFINDGKSDSSPNCIQLSGKKMVDGCNYPWKVFLFQVTTFPVADAMNNCVTNLLNHFKNFGFEWCIHIVRFSWSFNLNPEWLLTF